MKKNKLFMALMAGTIVISGCAVKTEKKEENKTAQVDTSKDTKEQLKQATDLYKKFVENQVDTLLKDTEKFATINGLLDKYKTDDKHYKLYTDLTKENTKELSEAVTKLGEPLSQMGVILDEEAK